MDVQSRFSEKRAQLDNGKPRTGVEVYGDGLKRDFILILELYLVRGNGILSSEQ